MRIFLALCLAVIVPTLAAANVSAKQSSSNNRQYGIVAVVNEDVITHKQLQDRYYLTVNTSKIQDTPENRGRIVPQLLQMLINEALQAQEMKRQNVKVTERDLEIAMQGIEQQNKLPVGGFDDFVRELNVSKDVVLEQLRAQIGWQKLTGKMVNPRVRVTESEILEVQGSHKTSTGPEANISVIMIPFERFEEQKEAELVIKDLYKAISGGSDFTSIAKQFSAGVTAKDGGKIGWVKVADSDPSIKQALETLKPGEVSKPVKSGEGYLLVKLHERKASGGLADVSHEKLKNMLMMKKIDLEARQLMRKLRDDAFIEIRS